MADIEAGNAVSSVNSTSTPLGSSGVFTGTAEEVSEYGTVSIAIFSNVASATDGFSVQFSTDGTNWDHTDVFTIPASTGKIFTIGPSARYFRVVYTNGTTAQTTFRLQSIFRVSTPKPSSHRIQDSISTNDDAELVKSILAGEDSITGEYENLKTTDGRLLVSQEVVAPAGTTEVIQTEFDDVNTVSGTDNLYTITNGTELTIQILQASAEDETGGSAIELFEDPNGDLSVLNRIGIPIIVNGSSEDKIIGESFTGDGTRRIVMRRRGYTANAREVGARWIGFEE